MIWYYVIGCDPIKFMKSVLTSRLGLNLPLQPVKIPVYYWRSLHWISSKFVMNNSECTENMLSVSCQGSMLIWAHACIFWELCNMSTIQAIFVIKAQSFLPHTFTFSFVNCTISLSDFKISFLTHSLSLLWIDQNFHSEFEISFPTLSFTNARVGMFGDFLLLSTKDSPRWGISI